MMRSDAHKLLADYTKRVRSNHELRRRRTQLPLWADSYDAAAACNQKRETGFDQADQIFINFQDLTEMLLKVKCEKFYIKQTFFIQSIEDNKKLYLVPVLELMQELYVQLEYHSTARLATENAMLDMVDHFHTCSGITARQVYQMVIECTMTIPGDTFSLNRIRYYLSWRLNEKLDQEGVLDWFWPLKYQIPLRPEAYRIPPLRRMEKKFQTGVTTQTPISIADAENQLLEFQNKTYELRWVLKPSG